MTIAARRRRIFPAPAADPALLPSRWRQRRRRARAGFTLLEILVALGVLGIIMSAVYGSYRAVSTSIVGLQPRIALEQRARFFLQQLGRQIRCCYGGRSNVSSPTTRQQNEEDARRSEKRPSLFQSGKTAAGDVLLRFVTSGGAMAWNLDSECLIVVSYKLDEKRRVLLTNEFVYGRRDEDDEDWKIVLEDVVEIEFEYFDGVDWQSKWDSKVSGGPPRAVRVQVALESPERGVVSFTTAASVLCCARPESRTRVQRSPDADKEAGK